MPNASLHLPMKRLQSADKVLGRIACVVFQPLRWARRAAGPTNGAENILLIKFWGIGSLQLLTPAVATLRRAYPTARLTLLTLSENEAFARGLGTFDEVRTLDVKTGRGSAGWIGIFARILRLVRDVRKEHYGVVYDFEFFTRFSALVSLATGARATHGYAAPNVWRGGFHTHTVTFNRYWHVARNFRALAGGEDGSEVSCDEIAPFRFSLQDEQRARRELELAGVPVGRPYVVLNPNAGQLSLERRWPAASFADLARRLAGEDETPVVLIGAAGEAEYVRAIAARIGAAPAGLVTNLTGKLSIGELCALLSRAGALVTNDSGPMHIAAALGTPTVAMFGPETPVMYGPLGTRTSALWKPPVCSPCINVHDNKVANCIHGQPECLVNIAVDEVLEATRLCLWDQLLTPADGAARRSPLRVVRTANAPAPAAAAEELRG